MAKFRLTGYVQGCVSEAVLNIFYLRVSFGVWKLGVLLISALTVYTSSGAFGGHFPGSPETSYPHCSDKILVIKHLPNTAKFAHLHIHSWVHI